MTIPASSVLERVGELLNDEDADRWTLPDRLGWLHAGLMEILIHKPSALGKSVVLPVQYGTRQPLPDNAAGLIRIVRNITSADGEAREGGRVIRTVSRVEFDAGMPDWHNSIEHGLTKEVGTAIVDVVAEPLAWYCYPPNTGFGRVEAVLAIRPAPFPVPSINPNLIDPYRAIEVDIAAEYQGALVDYILYRCYSKEAEFAGSAQRAQGHYAAFANALGVKLANEVRYSAGRTQADRQP